MSALPPSPRPHSRHSVAHGQGWEPSGLPLPAARCSAGLELGRSGTGRDGTGQAGTGRVRRDGQQLPRPGPPLRALVRRLRHTAAGAGPARGGGVPSGASRRPPPGQRRRRGDAPRRRGRAGLRGAARGETRAPAPTGDPYPGADVIRAGPPSPAVTSHGGNPSGRGRAEWGGTARGRGPESRRSPIGRRGGGRGPAGAGEGHGGAALSGGGGGGGRRVRAGGRRLVRPLPGSAPRRRRAHGTRRAAALPPGVSAGGPWGGWPRTEGSDLPAARVGIRGAQAAGGCGRGTPEPLPSGGTERLKARGRPRRSPLFCPPPSGAGPKVSVSTHRLRSSSSIPHRALTRIGGCGV